MIVDSFAGGGGASLGIFLGIGRHPDVAINHDAAAILMHKANHPTTKHYTEDVWKLAPRKVTGGQPVDLLWASPDCKHFSRAKGGKPVSKNIRSLAWVVVKWAEQSTPRIVILENVREFEEWGPLVPRWVCQDCNWKGTEGQAVLERRRRACPSCDATSLKQTEDLVPDPDRKGLTFKRFTGRLRNLGYEVQWRVLNAADYGAPTHRRRLFLIARRDRQPIIWPAASHADPRRAEALGLRPWRTAAECIDWSLPCPSIFERKRSLAEKTMRRIAYGIKRYVLDNPKPFIVDMQRENKAKGADEPLGTVTTQGNRFNLVTPYMVRCNHGGDHFRGQDLQDPLCTLTASRDAHAVLVPTLIQTGYGERKGQAPRQLSLFKPMGSVVAGGCKQGLVAAFMHRFHEGEPDGKPLDQPMPTATSKPHSSIGVAYLAKHWGGMVGVPVDTPLPTTTARGTQNQAVVANLVHLNHGHKPASACDEPMRTATAGGFHAALVYSFLVKYFGTAIGQAIDDPLHTQTSKGRFGVVTVQVNGETYVIVDIGMRMLTPRELARGQGFPDSYVLTGTATSQVARIGNSVPPPIAAALAEANFHAEPVHQAGVA